MELPPETAEYSFRDAFKALPSQQLERALSSPALIHEAEVAWRSLRPAADATAKANASTLCADARPRVVCILLCAVVNRQPSRKILPRRSGIAALWLWFTRGLASAPSVEASAFAVASAVGRNDRQATSASWNKAGEERARSSCCNGNALKASSNSYSAVSGGNSKSETASREAAPHLTGSRRSAALDAPSCCDGAHGSGGQGVAGGGSGGRCVGAHGSGGQNASKCWLLASPKCPVNGLAEGSEGRCLFCALPVGTAASRHAMRGLDPASHAMSSQKRERLLVKDDLMPEGA